LSGSEAARVQLVDAILFDPVGALAEFPAAPFRAAAAHVFSRSPPAGTRGSVRETVEGNVGGGVGGGLGRNGGESIEGSIGGSSAYWHLLDLLASCNRSLLPEEHAAIEAAEFEAVDAALVYDDAPPALGELAGLGVRLIVASSLSENALSRFLDRTGWHALFHDRWSRDTASGVADAVIRRAVTDRSLAADRVLFLTDTEAGLRAASRAGVRPILMMNEPDEAMRLTAYNPAGGIVSLHELPDFVRLVAARHARR
jgi:phosphoglycolate phosphatase-like HAD superfamily hydrolase